MNSSFKFVSVILGIFLLASVTTQFAEADWKEEIEKAKEKAREAVEKAKEKAREAAEKAKEKAREAADRLREEKDRLAQQAREIKERAAQQAREAADRLREEKERAAQQAREVQERLREEKERAAQQARVISQKATEDLREINEKLKEPIVVEGLPFANEPVVIADPEYMKKYKESESRFAKDFGNYLSQLGKKSPEAAEREKIIMVKTWEKLPSQVRESLKATYDRDYVASSKLLCIDKMIQKENCDRFTAVRYSPSEGTIEAFDPTDGSIETFLTNRALSHAAKKIVGVSLHVTVDEFQVSEIRKNGIDQYELDVKSKVKCCTLLPWGMLRLDLTEWEVERTIEVDTSKIEPVITKVKQPWWSVFLHE